MICCCFNAANERPVGNRRVGTEKHEIVWNRRRSDAKIRFGSFRCCPVILKVDAVRADDRETRRIRMVEACRANENIEIVVVSIGINAATICDRIYSTENNFDVVFPEGLISIRIGRMMNLSDSYFQISRTRRQTATADGPVWDEFAFQGKAVEGILHSLCESLFASDL